MIQSSVTKSFEAETVMKYIVEVHAPLLENPQTLAHKLVEKFNVRPQVASALMKLVPGTVTKPVSQKEAVTISTMLSGIGLQVSTRQVTAKQVEAQSVPRSNTPRAQPSPQKYGIYGLIFLSSFLPALLMATTALSVLMAMTRPALHNQLLTSARNPASVFASVAERVIGSNSIHSEAALNELDAALEDARNSLQEQNITFVMVTDAKGKPLAGWYKNDPAMLAVPETTLAVISKESQRITAQPSEDLEPVQLNLNNASFIQTFNADESLEVVAEAIEVNGERLGAVVVGVTNQTLLSTLRSALTRTVVVGTVLIGLGLLVGIVLSRAFGRSRFWQKPLTH
jgi:hypothetical protein